MGIVIGAILMYMVWLNRGSQYKSREGFQTTTANFVPPLESNPQTCAIFKTILERTKDNLEKIMTTHSTQDINNAKASVESITETLATLNCP